MMFNAYIINLKTSVHRKEYMEGVLAQIPVLNPVFIEAIDGRLMSDEEISVLIDQDQAMAHYGRLLRRAEIGCMLSHKKCAELLLDSTDSYALVLEDDLILQTYDLEAVFSRIDTYMRSEEPRILLLSGDYWFTKLKPFSCGYRIADVWDAVCSQAYFINKSAAQRFLSIKNWHLADDWHEIKNNKIVISALYPHIADQNRHDLISDIAAVYGGIERKKMSFVNMAKSYWRSFVDKFLVKIKHFEPKNFNW